MYRGSTGDQSYAPPPGPPPSYLGTHQSRSTSQGCYSPPLGPPPKRYAIPAQISTAASSSSTVDLAPSDEQYYPPPGPPPSHCPSSPDPPPYHDWTVIPDTALLPPPPAFSSRGHKMSPSSNASLSDADRAHDWCTAHPMIQPHPPSEAQHAAVARGQIRLFKPLEYKGHLTMLNTGFWKGSTPTSSKDSCLLTSLPLYFAAADSPLHTGSAKTIYFEVKVQSLRRERGQDDYSVALGYCAMPYPTWRMPGWERGSLAVHSDDGRRYVNDTDGGIDFTTPIKSGETVGIGIHFTIPENPPSYGDSLVDVQRLDGEVFFTRNGQRTESWNLHEQLDSRNKLGIDGLDGKFDLYGAVGTFGGVEFDVALNKLDWMWQPH